MRSCRQWCTARNRRAQSAHLNIAAGKGFLSSACSWLISVQQLIAADVSAVAFSAKPVTCSRDEVIINASWGLGESIVGGTVTQDTFVAREYRIPAVVGTGRATRTFHDGQIPEVDGDAGTVQIITSLEET
jgi:phosphoenolpyruvate synthase/pyruvate phosphate dikinase